MNKNLFDGWDMVGAGLAGFGICFISLMIAVSTAQDVTTVMAYQKLRDSKVSVSIDKKGEFWLWNESVKKSFKMDSQAVRELAAEVK